MIDFPRLNRLIEYQAQWIETLKAQQAQLEKYRDGVLPVSSTQIAQIASAQAGLSQAVQSIAVAIHGTVRTGQ